MPVALPPTRLGVLACGRIDGSRRSRVGWGFGEGQRRRAREARAAARRLVKESDQLQDRADVLMREAKRPSPRSARRWRRFNGAGNC